MAEQETTQQKVANASGLFQKLSILQDAPSGKNKLGYTVSAYKDVLSALQKVKYEIRDPKTNKVLGRQMSYSDVPDLVWDNNGFSEDTNAAIWKMSLSRYGAMPVINNETRKISIAKMEKQSQATRTRDECPTILTSEVNLVIKDQFLVGAKIDVGNLGIAYFNKMFCSRGGSQKIKPDAFASLVALGLLSAEVIFPNVNDAGYVGIIGTTQISDNSVIYINNCIFGCNGWQKFGVDVKGTNQKGEYTSLLGGGTHTFVLKGNDYSYKSHTIKDFGRAEFNKWLNQKSGTEMPIIKQEVIDTVYIRLFISRDNIDAALKYLPNGYSQEVFKTYGDVIRESATVRTQSGGAASVMLATSLEFWKKMRYNNKSDATGIIYTVGGGHNVNWKYQGEDGDVKFSRQGERSATFSPLFIPDQPNPRILDCSSFSCMMLFNSGIFDSTKIPKVLDSTELLDAQTSWGDKILPEYQISNTSFDGDASKILPGDVLYSTKVELNRTFGHAAVVYKYDTTTGDIWTLEINTTGGQNLPILKKNYHKADFYKHILRFVDKQ